MTLFLSLSKCAREVHACSEFSHSDSVFDKKLDSCCTKAMTDFSIKNQSTNDNTAHICTKFVAKKLILVHEKSVPCSRNLVLVCERFVPYSTNGRL